MDAETALFVVSAALAAFWSTVIGILHVRGWLPKAYISRLRDIQAQTASQVGAAVGDALRAVAVEQQASYEEAAAKASKSVEMSMVRGVRSLGDVQAKVDNAMAEAILGPALPILRQFAPGLAETLEENPQLIGVIIENPLFKKYIEPRILQFMGKPTSSDTGKNPFLGDLGQ